VSTVTVNLKISSNREHIFDAAQDAALLAAQSPHSGGLQSRDVPGVVTAAFTWCQQQQ